MMCDKCWKVRGCIEEPLPQGIDVKEEIRRMCREKHAVVMAHYYTTGDVQEVADFMGDSLALAQKAAKTDAKIIVMCGVHFMGETAKILCPDKVVLVPDLNATCSLAESCKAEEFEKFVKKHPGHTVVSYVNTTAATKAVTDVVVTSSNARQIVESFPKDTPLIFGPDRNLGGYINKVTGRHMLLWDGCCHVHNNLSKEKIEKLKKAYPDAKVLVHPECKEEVAELADKTGSTAALLKYSVENPAHTFIVATESGILHEMRKQSPQKVFISAMHDEESNNCNDCEYMKMVTLQKIYNTLKYEWPVVEVDPEIAKKAVRPIEKMLEISKKLGL